MEQLTEILEASKKRADKELKKRLTAICDISYSEALVRYQTLKSDLATLVNISETIRYYKDKIKEEPARKEELVNYLLSEIPTHYEVEEMKYTLNDLYPVEEVLQSIAWYLPILQNLETISVVNEKKK